ncbi:MAG: response regulator [Gammaproteobacteria bacterium]|nr:response regulator [Gammaproteobacteria bacterium]
MKSLIVEDDLTSRILLQEYLKGYGPSHVAVNGREAVEAVDAALSAGESYDLICLDVMMPELDGQQALQEIREAERSAAAGSRTPRYSKVVMTTALSDKANVEQAIAARCDGFLVKPIAKQRFLDELRKLNLIW